MAEIMESEAIETIDAKIRDLPSGKADSFAIAVEAEAVPAGDDGPTATVNDGAVEPSNRLLTCTEPKAVVDRPTTSVKAWVAGPDGSLCFPEVDDPDFAVSALNDKAPLAICIGGGGFRATTLALGWMRALQHLGVLTQAKYMCTISGSAWFGAALSFQGAADVGEFLGPYLPPDVCTLDALQDVGAKGRSYAAAVADATPIIDYIKNVGASMSEAEARGWTRAMATAFLKPFGLDEVNKSTVTMTGTKGDVHLSVAERAAHVGRDTVYTAKVDDLPYPIIGQVLMLPADETSAVYYPFEWTPLYSGCPVPYSTNPKLGGGWLETLGLNAELVAKPDGVKGAATQVLVRPVGPGSLGEAIGISSAYNSYKWKLGKTDLEKWAHKLLGFHTAQYFDHQEWSTNTLTLADGGGTDLFGIYPALRRKVPNIMVFMANGKSMDDFDSFARYMRELPGLFGCCPENPDDQNGLAPPEYNKQRQVFPVEGHRAMYDALLAKKMAGEPAVHVGEYEVLDCPAMGIKGGWRVRVMWVMNEKQANWEAALPKETRDKLDKERTCALDEIKENRNPLDAVTFREFPLINTMAMDYSPELVNLMANHAAWMLVQNKDLVLSMLEVAPTVITASPESVPSAAE